MEAGTSRPPSLRRDHRLLALAGGSFAPSLGGCIVACLLVNLRQVIHGPSTQPQCTPHRIGGVIAAGRLVGQGQVLLSKRAFRLELPGSLQLGHGVVAPTGQRVRASQIAPQGRLVGPAGYGGLVAGHGDADSGRVVASLGLKQGCPSSLERLLLAEGGNKQGKRGQQREAKQCRSPQALPRT